MDDIVIENGGNNTRLIRWNKVPIHTAKECIIFPYQWYYSSDFLANSTSITSGYKLYYGYSTGTPHGRHSKPVSTIVEGELAALSIAIELVSRQCTLKQAAALIAKLKEGGND